MFYSPHLTTNEDEHTVDAHCAVGASRTSVPGAGVQVEHRLNLAGSLRRSEAPKVALSVRRVRRPRRDERCR